MPRGILANADLIKISIEDKGRDKRTGKLYPVESPRSLTETSSKVIADELGDLVGDLTITNKILQKSGDARFDEDGDGDDGATDKSGLFELNLVDDGTSGAAAEFPMAPLGDGKIYFFGRICDGACDSGGTTGTEAVVDLTGDFVSLDEDLNSGVRAEESGRAGIAPWFRASVSVEAGKTVDIEWIYYQTSDQEQIVGGWTKSTYASSSIKDEPLKHPVFVDDEDETDEADQDAIIARVSSDGDEPSQNLRLKESSLFSGVYEGYVRITDSDGDGFGDHDNDASTPEQRTNWGLAVGDASADTIAGAAVIGVESGPVTISYRNSNGDDRTLSILIDKTAPTIQIDSPTHKLSSRDDSPDLLGTFQDGGGSGLREDSFKIYADNREDGSDDTPIWDLTVNETKDASGYVCAAPGDDGACVANGVVALRGHYGGYGVGYQTTDGTAMTSPVVFGRIKSEDVYLSTDDGGDSDDADDFKTADAERYDDGDTSGDFDSVVRIDFPPSEDFDNRYNNHIDLQAVVLDIAGNFGFSDSQATDPTFIHDYGTATTDDRDDAKVHNVLGWYSRHVFYLDDVDPYFEESQSATGYLLDEDDEPVHSSNGLMVVFDGDIAEDSVSVDTFVVRLDDGSRATITDVEVDGEKVYLTIEETLEPDATPGVTLGPRQSIEDLAGNEATDRRLDGIELSDGILPTFTITLSGGSGLNEGDEGPDKLTKNQITIGVSSNEAIQGAPKFVVLCNDFTWRYDLSATSIPDDDPKDGERTIATFESNRSGALGVIGEAAPNLADPGVETNCGEFVSDAADPNFSLSDTSLLARPGNNWEYQWSNLSGDEELDDGKLTVVVYGRDRNSYKSSDGGNLRNFNSASTTFTYDTELLDPVSIPANNEDVFEPRPFVLLDYGHEDTTVDVTSVMVDGEDVTEDIQVLDDNEFVWWPEPLAYGTYKVEVEANDAANNTDEESFSFTVKERAPFVLNLLAGWNSVSFPANPQDRALHAVFTNPAVDQVIGWSGTDAHSPWRMSTRVDGVWSTNDQFATLNDVEARYGYWVHSTGFITQPVKLVGKGDRSTSGQPRTTDIPTGEGWNFVGVIDVDGDQTQDHAGRSLRDGKNDAVTAAEYLGDYARAYTWDHVANSWDVINEDETMTIGSGVWVYYTEGNNIAP